MRTAHGWPWDLPTHLRFRPGPAGFGSPPRVGWTLRSLEPPRREQVKSAEEIMEILEAYDLTGSFRDAGELAGCSHHTVAGYVARREAGGWSTGGLAADADRRVLAAGGGLGASSRRARSVPTWCTTSCWLWGSPGRSGRPAGRSRCVKAAYRVGTGAGAPAVGDRAGDVAAVRLRGRPASSAGWRRCCSARGWPGRGSGWCCRCGTKPCPVCSPPWT